MSLATSQTIVTFCMAQCLNTWFEGWPEVKPTAYRVIIRQRNVSDFALAIDRTPWKRDLDSLNSNITVLAPLNGAYEVSLAGNLGGREMNEIVGSHVIKGKFLFKQIAGMKKLQTIDGDELRVCSKQGGNVVKLSLDGNDESSVVIQHADLEVGNGVVHYVDGLLGLGFKSGNNVIAGKEVFVGKISEEEVLGTDISISISEEEGDYYRDESSEIEISLLPVGNVGKIKMSEVDVDLISKAMIKHELRYPVSPKPILIYGEKSTASTAKVTTTTTTFIKTSVIKTSIPTKKTTWKLPTTRIIAKKLVSSPVTRTIAVPTAKALIAKAIKSQPNITVKPPFQASFPNPTDIPTVLTTLMTISPPENIFASDVTIADVLEANKEKDLGMFNFFLEKYCLKKQLEKRGVNFTVFAPINSAMRNESTCALLKTDYGRPLMANLIYVGTFALPTVPGTYVVGAIADNSSTLIISLDVEGHYCVNLSHRPPVLLPGAAILRSVTAANGVLYWIDDALSDHDGDSRIIGSMSAVRVLAEVFPMTYSLLEKANMCNLLDADSFTYIIPSPAFDLNTLDSQELSRYFESLYVPGRILGEDGHQATATTLGGHEVRLSEDKKVLAMSGKFKMEVAFKCRARNGIIYALKVAPPSHARETKTMEKSQSKAEQTSVSLVVDPSLTSSSKAESMATILGPKEDRKTRKSSNPKSSVNSSANANNSHDAGSGDESAKISMLLEEVKLLKKKIDRLEMHIPTKSELSLSSTTPASPKAKAAKKDGGHFRHQNPHSYGNKKKRRRKGTRNFAVPTNDREGDKDTMGLWQRILKLGEARLEEKKRKKGT